MCNKVSLTKITESSSDILGSRDFKVLSCLLSLRLESSIIVMGLAMLLLLINLASRSFKDSVLCFAFESSIVRWSTVDHRNCAYTKEKNKMKIKLKIRKNEMASIELI
uniref:Uncharacterized protein n=1 Tax=Glossina pallidipes TaxID=7398 RepID=A0A1A9ZE28_GLOPL